MVHTAALWQLAKTLDVCFLTVDPHVCDVDANTKALFKLLKSIDWDMYMTSYYQAPDDITKYHNRCNMMILEMICPVEIAHIEAEDVLSLINDPGFIGPIRDFIAADVLVTKGRL